MEQKELSNFSSEMRDLEDAMTQFLCKKYTHSGIALAEQLKDENWREKFTNWGKIRQILTYKGHPNTNDYILERPDRGITVILPKDDSNPDANYKFFKGAAFFPHQLDPHVYTEWRSNKDILIQLAYATHHRYFSARRHLVWLDTFFPLLEGHRICKYKNIPCVNENEAYYEFKIPEKYHGKVLPIANNLDDWKNDKEHLTDFFDKLLDIAQTGKIIQM